ncbi:head-tail joining protein [Candidatus Nitrotoga sp. M5]|uniref:head-tail joining protein n=1 Tax=Candidatus Nitrotoga sp. M5 TaxID=2890409 RepID=UPI001EF5125E|nr:hypothetical protein [Candidatus Nitrotoga sp. M5]CAH1387025.1 conserved hypothetical protein [Candidatus Nitrotoga sp. M5]
MAFTENLAPFFRTEDFAVDATLDGVAVVGIFNNDYDLEDTGGGASGSSPVFTLPSSDVPTPVAGLTLAPHPNPVKGTIPSTYKVVEPMPDGSGITKLRLRT